VEITVRHAEPSDAEALHRIMSGPRAAAGTLQLPLQSAEVWRRRLAEPPEGLFMLVACVEGEVVGNLGLHTSPNRPRTRRGGISHTGLVPRCFIKDVTVQIQG
jgi:L-phenylalanine/L-methionine N-acetyltransferase